MGQPFCERCEQAVHSLEEWKQHGEGKCEWSHVTPSAPRTLSEGFAANHIPADWIKAGDKLRIKTDPDKGVTITRGTPIEKLPTTVTGWRNLIGWDWPLSTLDSAKPAIIEAKINELVDRINAMNELPRLA